MVIGEEGTLDEGKLLGWRQSVETIKIDDMYEDGPKYLQDIRRLEKIYGFDDTYSYSDDMLTQEMFIVIIFETILVFGCFLVTIFFLILILTGTFAVAFLVVFSVCLVNLFLLALIPIWGMTFNNLLVVHLIASLGLSVLYTSHISHAYIMAHAPDSFSQSKQRSWKAHVALSHIGNSVLHGSIATLLAVLIVGYSRNSYFFVVFFKLWLGIVVFSSANAFILIPIILSLWGPTPDYKDRDALREKKFIARVDTMTKR